MSDNTHLSTPRPLHAAHNPRQAVSDAVVPLCLEAVPTEYAQPTPTQQVLPAGEPNRTVNQNIV